MKLSREGSDEIELREPPWTLSAERTKSFSAAPEPPHACQGLMQALEDVDTPIDYYDLLREYSVLVLDGGSSSVVFEFCPWCGGRLPSSLRNTWFAILDRLGLDPEDELPPDLCDGTWWREGTRE